MADIEYLEEERKKLWAKIIEIETKITELIKTTPEHEREVKNASKEISKYKNRVISAFNEVETNKTKIAELIQKSEKINNAAITADAVDTLLSKAQGVLEQSNIEQNKLNTNIQNLNEQNEELETLQENASTILTNATSIESKLKGLLQNSADIKQNIEDIYDEIEGYDTEKDTHVLGLKEKLKNSFEKIEKDNINLKKDFENTKEKLLQWKDNFIKSNTAQFDTLLEKIKGLLPGAMSAGLSASYAEKKKEEVIELNNAKKSFKGAIIWMSIIALIPIVYYFYLYRQEKNIEYILNHIPQITLAILPLYAPVIWFAALLNKNINLSKKLIEEYAYKEALNKTYEGLAGQIQNLRDKDNELRREHLQIILKTSAENPGKYITGYDKCDNPLLELLSKPEKLSKLLKDKPFLITLFEQALTNNRHNDESIEKQEEDKQE